VGLWQPKNDSFLDIAETEIDGFQPTNATGRGRSTTRKGESPTKSVKQSGNKSSMILKEEK